MALAGCTEGSAEEAELTAIVGRARGLRGQALAARQGPDRATREGLNGGRDRDVRALPLIERQAISQDEMKGLEPAGVVPAIYRGNFKMPSAAVLATWSPKGPL